MALNLSCELGSSPLEQEPPERMRAPLRPDLATPRGAIYESGCSGMQLKLGGESRLRLNTGERPIVNKYCNGKMKKTLKRESKSV